MAELQPNDEEALPVQEQAICHMTQLLFERPVQTIKAISLTTGISRTTILKACQKGLLGDCLYRSGDTWLIDTSCQQFIEWLAAHPTQRRVRGQLNKNLRTYTEIP